MVVVLQMTPNAIPSLRYRYITPVCPLLCCLVILHLLDSNSFIIILQAVSISTVEEEYEYEDVQEVTAKHNQNHEHKSSSSVMVSHLLFK